MLTGARVVQEASWPRFAPTHILSKSHKDASGGRVSLPRHRNKQADQRRSAAGDWWKFQRHRSCWGNMKLISRRGGGRGLRAIAGMCRIQFLWVPIHAQEEPWQRAAFIQCGRWYIHKSAFTQMGSGAVLEEVWAGAPCWPLGFSEAGWAAEGDRGRRGRELHQLQPKTSAV